MRYTIIIIALLAPLAVTMAASLGDSKLGLNQPKIPASVLTLRQLYRSPPVEINAEASDRATVETRWISQKLDNFNDTNEQVWDDRILINEKYHVDGAPIFIYLGGEWEIGPGDIKSGLLVDIAKQHNGSLVYTEHRFFGQSIPIKPFTTKNLQYQSVEQALADVVNVIDVLKSEDKYKNSKVVVAGCSYSATMSVWLKLLYPDVIVGSWASSAPLEAKVDFKDFMKVVGNALWELGGDYCYNLVDNATSYYEGLFQSGQGAEAKKQLNLCEDFDENDERDQWQIFSTIANLFAGLVQYQKPENYDIAKYCSVLRDYSDDDAIALSKFVQWRLNNPDCVSARYQGSVDYYKWAMENSDVSDIGWTYQTCRQFGWFQSSGSSSQPFGSSFPATLYTDICHDVFGSKYTASRIRAYISATNAEYGGKYPDVENVHMSHGGLDPWAKVGAGLAQGATIIPQHSHCPDRGSISATDTAELVAAKNRVIEVVREWLA